MMEKKKNVPVLRFPEFSEEWETKKIGDILKIGSGKDYKHLGSGDIPVFGTGGLMAKVDNFLFDGETVCIGRKGTIDKPMFYDGKIWTVDTLFYTHSFKNSKPKFIFNLFQRINWKDHNEASGVPSLSKSTIEQIELILPTLSEQQKIASFLSAVDDKFQALKKKKNLLDQYKKGVMQKIFSQELRFIDDNGNEFSKWEKKKLNNLVKIMYGKDQKKVLDENGKYPILGTGGIIGRTNQFLCDNPSVLIGRKGTIDKPVYMDTPFWTVDTLFYTEVFSNTFPKWLYYKFQTINWYLYNEASGVPSLSGSTIYNIKIGLPCYEEQIKIANFLSAIDDKINLCNTQIEKTEQWKKGLLQKMFV